MHLVLMESLAHQLFMETLVNLDPQEMRDPQEDLLVILLILHVVLYYLLIALNKVHYFPLANA